MVKTQYRAVNKPVTVRTCDLGTVGRYTLFVSVSIGVVFIYGGLFTFRCGYHRVSVVRYSVELSFRQPHRDDRGARWTVGNDRKASPHCHPADVCCPLVGGRICRHDVASAGLRNRKFT